MKAMTSKEREAAIQVTPESYQHPKPIPGHVYMITNVSHSFGDWKGTKYYAVNEIGTVRLYNIDSGVVWCSNSAFGDPDNEWEDITDQVYLNTDELES